LVGQRFDEIAARAREETERVSDERRELYLASETVAALADAITQRTARTTLRVDEAAARLGVSRDFYDEFVAPELREIRRGRLRLVRVADLEQWANAAAARPLETR
jgi:excisionase family DNA binding protein